MLVIGMPDPKDAPDEKQVLKRIDRAKIQLMMEKGTTFFSALIANLKLVLDTRHRTAATDAIHLFFNPNFVMEMEDNHLVGILLHEVMHVVLDHCNFEIYEDCNQYVLGIAMDHHINLYITALGYSLPSFAYCDRKFRGMSSMQIYHELMKDPPPEPPNWQGDVIAKPSEMSAEEYQEHVESNIIKAVLQAEMANDFGSIPGHIQQKVKELVSPTLPWDLILMKHMDQYAKEDYSYSRPNRRYQPDFYLPCMHSEKLGGCTFVLDVSGSMDEEDLGNGMAQCRHIRDLLAPEWIHMMTIDTRVHLDKVFEQYDELPAAELEGGGGTVLEPVIKRIVEYRPEFAIIFTDGYFGNLDMSQVESDIYWVIIDNPNFQPPAGVGEVIHFNK